VCGSQDFDNYPGPIENRLEGDIRVQLSKCVTSDTVKEDSKGKTFCAYAVVIIGSRHILIREMDDKGKWKGVSRLVTDSELEAVPDVEAEGVEGRAE